MAVLDRFNAMLGLLSPAVTELFSGQQLKEVDDDDTIAKVFGNISHLRQVGAMGDGLIEPGSESLDLYTDPALVLHQEADRVNFSFVF